MNEYIPLIEQDGITSEIIRVMINDHKPDHDRMVNFYERYKASASGVPILTRKPIKYDEVKGQEVIRIDDKVNNKINNAYDAEITDTKVGYLFGSPITYNADEQTGIQETLSDFNKRNNIEDADSELGKKATICGYGARLLYIDPDGNEAAMTVNPWEAIILSETDDITNPKYALRYYKTFTWGANGKNPDEKVDVFNADFYDVATIFHFESTDGEDYLLKESKPHMFDYCPLFGVPNNQEMKGDAEKVLPLIDAYDRTLSDVSNEIEQYRLAYLVAKGAFLDETDQENMKRTGVINLDDETQDVKYLTKELNDSIIEHHLDRLEENIMRFSKSVNFSDESFGTTVTGVAMRYKLMALEHKAITMERKMTAGLRYQFKVLCSAWSKKRLANPDDYLQIDFQFKRNLPDDILSDAQASVALKGVVSEQTRLSLLPFVTNVKDEMDRMHEDAAIAAESVYGPETLPNNQNTGDGADESTRTAAAGNAS
ncbi:phage portal protein [Sporolactobacillus laevolacticus]|uniref:Phage portal protein n=1 Tax=Sporolactobacillus laevolacticus DSM 442 TaxID=1395513 RepID=V6J5N4_9BACL|nr:phage portal protein [Sporolactobacillus laevolacticus]EST12054.1 phage portal protein [Sporolactobacillus laevolacticus DSM 442]